MLLLQYNRLLHGMCTRGEKDVYGQARAGVKLGRTYGETNCHYFSKGIVVVKATWYIKYGRWCLEIQCAKRTPKHF